MANGKKVKKAKKSNPNVRTILNVKVSPQERAHGMARAKKEMGGNFSRLLRELIMHGSLPKSRQMLASASALKKHAAKHNGKAKPSRDLGF